MLVKPISGTVPKKLRDIGLKTLLSMKYRYDKLFIVEDLSSDRFVQLTSLAKVYVLLNVKTLILIHRSLLIILPVNYVSTYQIFMN